MADEIIRNPSSRTQNTVLPAPLVYPDSLNIYPTRGIQSLNNTIKALSKRPAEQTSYGTVLECWPPAGPLKSKYKLPHMNLSDDKMLEDFLLKIRDPNYDEGSRVNPEEFLIVLQKLDLEGKASSFFSFAPQTSEQKIALKNYYDAVAVHRTFAPKYSSGILSSPPLPGSKVKIEYFQHPYVSAGHTIAGVYEKIYDDDIFEAGIEELRKLLQPYRQGYLNAALSAINAFKNFISNGNTPGVNPQSQNNTTQQAQGEYGNVSDPMWPPKDVVSAYIGDPASPSRQLYDQVIDQFEVSTNPRYMTRDVIPEFTNKKGEVVASGEETFCNIFVADVTWAMGLPVPWVQDSNGNPYPMSTKITGDLTQLGANAMGTWLRTHGPRYEWKEVSGQEAQNNANSGLVTVATCDGHVGIVRPGEGKKIGNTFWPMTAQAGWGPGKNPNNISANQGFAGRNPHYYTCFRKSRYVTPTKQQLDSISNQQSVVANSNSSDTPQQENPPDTSSAAPPTESDTDVTVSAAPSDTTSVVPTEENPAEDI